jgi:hypothetical protein
MTVCWHRIENTVSDRSERTLLGKLDKMLARVLGSLRSHRKSVRIPITISIRDPEAKAGVLRAIEELGGELMEPDHRSQDVRCVISSKSIELLAKSPLVKAIRIIRMHGMHRSHML